MPPYSEILPKELLAAFLKAGFQIVRQTGSHARLQHQDGRRITIALHPKPLAKGTLSAILRQARMSKKDLESLFKS